MGFGEQRFTKTVDEEFRCPICRDIVDEPLLSQCEHVFCRICIHEWLSRESSCPVDRQPLRAHHLSDVSRFYRNFYTKLDIKCEFQPIGCLYVSRIDKIKEHQISCEFNPNIKSECKQGCNAMVTRSEVSSHNCVQYLMEIIDQKNQLIKQITEKESEYKRKLIDFQITIKTKNSEINHLNECLFEKQNQSSECKTSIVPLIRSQTELSIAQNSINSIHKFKLLLVGDKGVGKSCLLMNFIGNNFVETNKSVNGYRSRTIELDDCLIDLEVWENSRQFNVFTDFRELDGIMFVYDVTKWKSFKNLKILIKDMKHKTKKDIKRLLVGNKCDNIETKTVDYLSALKFSQLSGQLNLIINKVIEFKFDLGIPFIETSAKSGAAVEEAFYRIVTQSVIQLTQFRSIN